MPANIDLNEKNMVVNKLSKKSATFNFSKEDAIPDAEFTEVIWKGIKGMGSAVPAPRRAGFLTVKKGDD